VTATDRYVVHASRFGPEGVFEAAVEETDEGLYSVDELLDLVRHLREAHSWSPTKEQTEAMARGRIRHIKNDWNESESRDVERLLGVGQRTLRRYRQELLDQGVLEPK
jgi:Fic family protein